MSAADIITKVIEREGDFCDNPADKGGPTRWGITEAVARTHGYAGDMRELPRGFAAAIYMHTYVNAPGFNLVLGVSVAIADELIDTGVNMGTSIPGPWLQRILNALNQQSKLYADLVVDGAIGPATVAALRTLLAARGADGVTVILRALNCLQGARYLELTEKREQNEIFFFGWMLNRVGAP